MSGSNEGKSKAFRSGWSDGVARVTDAHIAGQPTDRAELLSWFGDGQEEADGALISALGANAAARELGVDPKDESAFVAACDEYNAGFRAGVLGSR